jgi:hypothetical protein
MQCFGIVVTNDAQRSSVNGIKSKWKCTMTTSTDSKVTAYIFGVLAGVLFVVWALSRDDGEGATVVDKLGDGVMDLLDGILRGTRVTFAPYNKTTGAVNVSPSDLAAQAGVDIEVYSLARMISSEEGRSSNTIKAAVGWAAVNHAQSAGKTLTDVLTTNKNHQGLYGTQVGGYASTANDPYEGDIAIANAILSGDIADMTGGADQFDRPSGEANADTVAANRIASGSHEVVVPGIDDGDIRFWSKA